MVKMMGIVGNANFVIDQTPKGRFRVFVDYSYRVSKSSMDECRIYLEGFGGVIEHWPHGHEWRARKRKESEEREKNKNIMRFLNSEAPDAN